MLGDALRALLLDRGQEDWDLVLPQLLRAFRGTPHAGTGETANLLMLGRELRLPDLLTSNPPPIEHQAHHEYTQELVQRLEEAHDMLREQQMAVRQEDSEEPPLFQTGDLVLLQNVRRKKGENPKLQPKFVGPYEVISVFDNHTYSLERLGQRTVQNECRLKLYRPCAEKIGQAPGSLDPTSCKKPAKARQTRRQAPAAPSRSAVRCEPRLEEEPEEYFWPLQNEEIKREVETIPVELDNHLPPIERQMTGQPSAIEQEQAEELTNNGEEDASSDTTLVEEDIDEIPETGDVGAPGVAENTESIEGELPAPVTTRYGRTIKMPKRFGDYICNEVKSDLTQELDESEGAQHTPELDMADHGESSPLAATLGYLRRDVQPLVQE